MILNCRGSKVMVGDVQSEKSFALMLISHGAPALTSWNSKNPFSVVVTVRRSELSDVLSDTVESGIGSPFSSVTVPIIVPGSNFGASLLCADEQMKSPPTINAVARHVSKNFKIRPLIIQYE